MTQPDLVAALAPVIAALDGLGVEYCIVGSVASSAHGMARSTIDADVVADLPELKLEALVERLEADYYVDLDAARDAVRRHAMFNTIHLATMIKVDIYVLTQRPFDRGSFARRIRRSLPGSTAPYAMNTAEDTVLHKLEWYRAGGEVSERQWHDVVGVLEVQGASLDREYLEQWAQVLGVSDLLSRALDEVERCGQ